jgi:hypothetical protein
MAKLYASWVPGYATVPELMGSPPLQFPNGVLPPGFDRFTDVNGWRRGFGAFFAIRAGNANWFHIPIPTPVLVEDRRATLGRVMILYQIEPSAVLDHVLVFDGPNGILDRAVEITGNHIGGLDPDNTFDVNHDGIAFGVGISLHFSARGGDAQLRIASAGADFFHNI